VVLKNLFGSDPDPETYIRTDSTSSIDPTKPIINYSHPTANSISVNWSTGEQNSATEISYQIVYEWGWGQILRNDITVSNNPYQIQSLYPNTDYVIKIEKIYTLDGRVASMSSEEADVKTTNSLWDLL